MALLHCTAHRCRDRRFPLQGRSRGWTRKTTRRWSTWTDDRRRMTFAARELGSRGKSRRDTHYELWLPPRW